MLELVMPWPPSSNTMYATFQGRRILSRKGRQYHRDIADMVLRDFGKRHPFTGRLQVVRIYYPPDRRKRDLANLTKAIDDALTKAGVWVDDCQIDEETNRRGPVVTAGRALIRINVLKEEP